jgi:hypothetical protein
MYASSIELARYIIELVDLTPGNRSTPAMGCSLIQARQSMSNFGLDRHGARTAGRSFGNSDQWQTDRLKWFSLLQGRVRRRDGWFSTAFVAVLLVTLVAIFFL